MKQIRHNVFETNSSSTHSIVICDKYLYDEWLEDRAYLDTCWLNIVKDIPKEADEHDHYLYITRTDFDNRSDTQEICAATFKDSNGTTKIAMAIEIGNH